MTRFKGHEATISLILVNVIMFILQSMTYNGVVTLGGFFAPYVVVQHQYWRFVASGFLHANTLHLAVNMLSLYQVGMFLEPFFKKDKFLLLYIMSVVMGNLVTFAFGSWQVISVGASSAIFGMFIAVVLLVKMMPYHAGIKVMSQKFLAVIAINLILSFSPGINIYAHLGGMLGGVFAFYGLGYFKDNKRYMILVFLLYAIVGVVLYLIGMNRLF